MNPWVLAGITALNLARNSTREDRDRQGRALELAWSPWFNVKPREVREADPLGNVVGAYESHMMQQQADEREQWMRDILSKSIAKPTAPMSTVTQTAAPTPVQMNPPGVGYDQIQLQERPDVEQIMKRYYLPDGRMARIG